MFQKLIKISVALIIVGGVILLISALLGGFNEYNFLPFLK